ncbi:MAG TPA: twin-arginine translocase subunit TatC [Bryobacteraceae bacterium]|nr:twin-arginine translocase subunit TatC [Bryobacteraceae bacterium]
MLPEDEKPGTQAPVHQDTPIAHDSAAEGDGPPAPPSSNGNPEHVHTTGNEPLPAPYQSPSEDPYGAYDDPYAYHYGDVPAHAPSTPAASTTSLTTTPPPPTTPPPAGVEPPEGEEDEEDDGMLRMSFLEHLEELRSRLIKAIAGLAVAFVVSLTFTDSLWDVIRQPAKAALESLGVNPPNLVMLSPMDGFSIIWMKLPLLCSIFIASPWILYQIWAFVAPGLYRKERRYAVPFVLCSAGLFLLGGAFAYFVAFRFGLTFLLGIGFGKGVTPYISVVEYFDLFINVMLGVGLVFELPVVIFFLTLLRIATPSFLLRNSRYAILGIVVLAAIVTPTPDVYNLTIFAVPMVFLYFIGVFASYLLTLNREQKRFPWLKFLVFASIPVLLAGAWIVLAVFKFGYKLVPNWPFLVR